MTGHSHGFSVEDLREIYEAENPLAEIFAKVFRALGSLGGGRENRASAAKAANAWRELRHG